MNSVIIMLMNPNTVPHAQPDPQLVQYFQAELAQGYSVDQIALSAQSSGWNSEQIKACVDWLNSSSAQNNSPAQTQASPSLINGSFSQNPPKKKARSITTGLFIVCALIGAGLLIMSALNTNDANSLNLAIQKNLTTTSFERTLTTKMPQKDGSLTLLCQCDLSEPNEPKANVQMTILYSLGTTRESLNQVSINVDSVVVGDTVWMRVNQPVIALDEATRASFAEKTATKETTDEAIKDYYGLSTTGRWKQFFADVERDQSFEATLLPYIYGTVTLFNDFIIGNLGTNAEEIRSLIDDEKLYRVTATSNESESFDGASAQVLAVTVDREAYLRIAQSVDTNLGLSERHEEQLQSTTYTGLLGTFNAWLDSQGTLYKIASVDNETTILYKDFGASYDIIPPELEIDTENFDNIQEDLRRFPEGVEE